MFSPTRYNNSKRIIKLLAKSQCINLTLCPLGNFSCFLSSADIFISFFWKIHSELLSRVANSLDPDQADNLLGLAWVQTVCKGCQQTTQGGKKLRIILFISQPKHVVVAPRNIIHILEGSQVIISILPFHSRKWIIPYSATKFLSWKCLLLWASASYV